MQCAHALSSAVHVLVNETFLKNTFFIYFMNLFLSERGKKRFYRKLYFFSFTYLKLLVYYFSAVCLALVVLYLKLYNLLSFKLDQCPFNDNIRKHPV